MWIWICFIFCSDSIKEEEEEEAQEAQEAQEAEWGAEGAIPACEFGSALYSARIRPREGGGSAQLAPDGGGVFLFVLFFLIILIVLISYQPKIIEIPLVL